MSHSGIIKKILHDKGFGFIRASDQQEYFFHRNGLQGLVFSQVAEGDAVCFDLQASAKKAGAHDAIKVRAHSAGTKQPSAGRRTAAATRAPVAADLYPPYRFVPIDVERAVTDAPVWHDGEGSGELLSGELLCTLEALTPLLAGNDRYTVAAADREQLAAWGFADLPKEKQIAEPLRLSNRQVVIPGSALKGMLRHSLAALLSAPMDRVGERHYTYRPNLQVQEGAPQNSVTRPAVYTEAEDGTPRVWVLDDVRAATFVRDVAIRAIRAAACSNGLLPMGTTIAGVSFQTTATGSRILRGDSWTTDREYSLLEYRGGTDGEGKLGAKFLPPTKTYTLALVPQSLLDRAVELDIGPGVLQAYRTTQSVLANGDTGHLFSHPLLDKQDVGEVAKAIRSSTEFAPWQLVYVEVKLDNGKLNSRSKILSIGHHFRYRWAYTSSIRQKGGKVRACLSPLAGERQDRPTELSGARLFCGYVHDQENPVGKNEYERLAGRIAVNHALSVGEPEFLGKKEEGWCVPLPILGTPKASSWEFYLQQKQGSGLPATYGDLPGDDGGELAGRNFYLHQPGIRGASDIVAATLAEAQATLARFICKPQTTFRFTLRFARLRPWELAALHAVLEPARLAQDKADYAHKLGLGRPLGLGSVRIKIDRLRVRCESETRLTEQADLQPAAVNGLREKLNPACLERWLDVHRFENRGRIAYPTARGKDETTIFNWHTDIRREYSKLRRESEPDSRRLMNKILPGQKLPPTD